MTAHRHAPVILGPVRAPLTRSAAAESLRAQLARHVRLEAIVRFGVEAGERVDPFLSERAPEPLWSAEVVERTAVDAVMVVPVAALFK